MSTRISLYQGAAFAALTSAALAAPAYALEPVTRDEIIVTASPLERTVAETILGTSVLADEELARRLENTIGETLRREPGVSSTFFGPGASRPVIRGLGGDRIRVLNAGIGTIDASATSPDHAVAVEPAIAERIEIVRGTAMLLYGSSAAGGVVNVFDGRIPTELPEGGISGGMRIDGATVDSSVGAAGAFDLDLGRLGAGNVVFHGDGYYRKAKDYKIPGFAESARLRALEDDHDDHDDDDHDHDHDDEHAFGRVENSAFESKGGAAGLSWVFDNGFIGFSASATNTYYGVPGGHAHAHHDDDHDDDDDDHDHDDDHAHHDEGGVTIGLRQRRIDMRSEFEGDFGLFRKAKLRMGYADYEHEEIEPDGDVGTVFSNHGWEGRFELVDKPWALGGGTVDGAMGFQWSFRNFSAIGDEAFTPPTKSSQYGFFMLKEYSQGPWRAEIGGRYERTTHDVVDAGIARAFNGFSVSGGLGVKPTDATFLGVTAFRTERAPSVEELFSNGPHLATGSFEVGDPDLDEEVARGIEATARIITDRFKFTINGFRTSYRGFIYEARTDEEEDGLPVFEYRASDAVFTGFEAKAEAELFQLGAFDVHADAGVDLVRARARPGGGVKENLPRIPPVSALIGLEARSSLVDLRGEVEIAAAQNRVAEFELPTDGYTMVNTFVTLRPFVNAQGLSVRFAAMNLTNEEARTHASFLKDVAPLPGRNFRVSLAGSF